MSMRLRLRRFVLTAHVSTSVGWLGAVAAFLVLAVIGLTSPDTQVVRAFYLLADPFTDLILVPLALAALLTGIVQGLGTSWGLFRHYWVVYKLVLTVVATVVLLAFTQRVQYGAAVAADPGADLVALRGPGYAGHAVGGLLVLLMATVLSVYKPPGMTRHGRRTAHGSRRRSRPAAPSGPGQAGIRI